MLISEIPSGSLPSPEFRANGIRYTAATLGGLIAVKAEHTLTNIHSVPSESLITLGEYQIISQEWLKIQPPLAGFFEEGQSLNPPPKQTDDTKRQCWEDKGVYRYNELGSQWTLEQLGARVPSYDEIVAIHAKSQGKKNAEKMKNIGVVATGWRGAGDGRGGLAEFACLRSSSPKGNGDMLTAGLHPDRFDVGSLGFKSRTGMAPFGVMDKKISA